MDDADKAFKVVVWFTNGEVRIFKAYKTFTDGAFIAIKSYTGVVSFDLDKIAGVMDESRSWPEGWE